MLNWFQHPSGMALNGKRFRNKFGMTMVMCFLVACSFTPSVPLTQHPEYSKFPDEQLKILVQKNDADAQYELGNRLCCGIAVGQDSKRGFALLCSAAKQEQVGAQYRLGELYEKGVAFQLSPYNLKPFLIPKDLVSAYMWYSIAAENGYGKAESARKRLHETLSLDQLSNAIAKRKIWRRLSCSDD